MNILVSERLCCRHGAFDRWGGVSRPPYDSLNLSFGVGDAEVNVRENRRRLMESLGAAVLASARQVHGDRVKVIDSPLERDTEFDGYDGLVTDQPGLALLVQQADCQAVLLHDPVQRVVAAVHVGWRGSIAGIIGKTVSVMGDRFGCKPQDLLAWVSPSLGPCCAEFVNHRQELPARFRRFETSPNHFDFWAISREQLLAAGLNQERIESAGICTCCESRFFSYRREKVTGRQGSAILLPP